MLCDLSVKKHTHNFNGTVQEITRKVAQQGVARKLLTVTPNVLNSKAKYGKNMSVKEKCATATTNY